MALQSPPRRTAPTHHEHSPLQNTRKEIMTMDGNVYAKQVDQTVQAYRIPNYDKHEQGSIPNNKGSSCLYPSALHRTISILEQVKSLLSVSIVISCP
jgi:hypothetical protein